MKKRISHISLHQCSKVIAILYFLITLLFTVPAALLLFIIQKEPAFFLYLAYPFIFALFTYLFTALFLFLYNRVASSFGGFEFELEEEE